MECQGILRDCAQLSVRYFDEYREALTSCHKQEWKQQLRARGHVAQVTEIHPISDVTLFHDSILDEMIERQKQSVAPLHCHPLYFWKCEDMGYMGFSEMVEVQLFVYFGLAGNCYLPSTETLEFKTWLEAVGKMRRPNLLVCNDV